MTETLSSKTPVEKEEKAHRWRRCPVGKHLVREHLRHNSPSEAHPEGMVTTVWRIKKLSDSCFI